MSHEILQEDRLVFTGAVPWHGIGINLPPTAGFEEWYRRSGLDWSIVATPVEYKTADGRQMKFPNRFVMSRSDSGTPLSIASERFKAVQPREILGFFKDLVETQGFQLETVGTLKNGKYIWGLAKVGKMAWVGDGEDMVRAYLLLATICQPGFATSARFTGVRVVCNNTLSYALEGGSAVTKVSHIEEFDPVAMKDAMGLGVSSFERFIMQSRRLAAQKITNEEALEYFMHVVGDPELEPEDPKQPTTLMALQRNYLESPQARLVPSTNSTLWAALNAVTHHVDYGRPDRGPGGRLTSAWFGSGRQIKDFAWNTAVSYERTGSFEVTKSGAPTVQPALSGV